MLTEQGKATLNAEKDAGYISEAAQRCAQEVLAVA